MRKIFLSMFGLLSISLAAMADEVPGVTVEYLDEKSDSYVQAISAIGRIEFKGGNATIVFKDAEAGKEELGAISGIRKISFGKVEENDITKTENPTAVVGVERKVSVSAYPNPTADHVHISGMEEGLQVRMFTSDGRLTYVGRSSDIDLSGMPSGVYLLQVGKEVVKVIKK
ncbi:MAG: T9SS type A sorting domain-containing protein [Bacteroidales bacterium]|nr:T9SS type A sorting domain-containing protein [Bacteroidales bacterium]